MVIDSSRPLPAAPRPKWELPAIVEIRIRRTGVRAPEHKHFRSALPDRREAVEFLVRTSGPIPARALGPALFVGDVEVAESQEAGENLYRFFAFDLDRLKLRAPIAWGWLGPKRNERIRTKYRYELARE
jgi:hypothetical protein